MARYLKRHSLQARITHGVVAISCILLMLTGAVVFIPQVAAALPSEVVFAIRISHRVIGGIFLIVPLVSAFTALKGVKHLWKMYTQKWDSDDRLFMIKFVPYMLNCKKVHMPDQKEVKSGQVIADGMLFFGCFLAGITGIFLVIGTSGVALDPGFMVVNRFLHNVAFFILIIFGIAHIFLGSGAFQPYRGTARLMFKDGLVSESDALYHWGHWARAELEKGGDNVVEIPDAEDAKGSKAAKSTK